VEELKEQDAPETGSSLDFAIGSHRLGKQVIEAEGVDISRGGNQLVRSFDELIVPGDRIGIIGPNGIGKTTLLNALARRVKLMEGRSRSARL
jgi:ATP-binding cassette subfamily F protein uup